MQNIKSDSGRPDIRSAALDYARHGHPVFPVKPDGSKKPAIPSAHPEGDPLNGKCKGGCGKPGHGFYDASTDAETVREHWNTHPRSHIGLRPAEDEAFIDVEGPNGDHDVNGLPIFAELVDKLGPLDGHPMAETPSGGFHIWGTHDLAPNQIAAHPAPGIDVKAHSGYAVAPPSPGRRWQNPLQDTPPRFPDAWQQWMRKPVWQPTPQRPSASDSHGDDAYVDTAVDRELHELADTPKSAGRHGGRNKALYAKAARLDELGVQRDWARQRLLDACHRNGVLAEDGEKQCNKTIDSAFGKVGGNGNYIPNPPRRASKGANMTRSGEKSAADTTGHASENGRDSDVPPAQIHRGQARFAYLLADDNDGKLLFVYGIGWFFWDDRRWRRDDKGKTRRAVLALTRRQWRKALHDKELLGDCRKVDTAAGINGVLEIASALEPFAATVDDLDADPYMLNVATGTLDLHALELRPFSQADRITKIANGAHDPTAATLIWDAFLAKVLPDEEVRKFVQRLAGLALVGEVREHILPIFTGTGRNGKSTLYEAIMTDVYWGLVSICGRASAHAFISSFTKSFSVDSGTNT